MNGMDLIEDDALRPEAPAHDASALLRPLIEGAPVPTAHEPIHGVVLGRLAGLDAAGEPLVIYPGQPGSAALRARTTVDVHAPHIGRTLVLMFEGGDRHRPLIMGLVREENPRPAAVAGHVEVEADGERLLVTAREQLVLRCGKASITLTQAGKVLIQGAYVSSRSTGVNRIKGGSVQLN